MAPAPTRGSFRFDKYMAVMAALRESGYPLTEHAPPPMPRRWLEAVHCPGYVEEVFTAAVPHAKERRIGFPVTPHISQRVQHTNGGTWLAAQLARRHGYAANSAAGSHRAGYNGVWSLHHAKGTRSLFVPGLAGLNLEHLVTGELYRGQWDDVGTPERLELLQRSFR